MRVVLTHRGKDSIATFFAENVFKYNSWLRTFVFPLQFHLNIFPKVQRIIHFADMYMRNQVSNCRKNIMMTSSNGNIFRVTGPLYGECSWLRWIPPTKLVVTGSLCRGFTGLRSIPLTKAVTRSLDVSLFFAWNKRLSKQSWGWWFETPSRLSWRQFNGNFGMWAGHVMQKDYCCRSFPPIHTSY